MKSSFSACLFLFRVLVVSAAFLLLTGKSVSAADVRPPDQVVSAFYKWYVHEMNADREPVYKERSALKAYVSKKLLHRIDTHAVDDGADYFTKSQDIMEDWEGSIAITQTKVAGNMATVAMTMGKSKESLMKFTLTLRIEDGVWKILQIRDDGAGGRE